MSRENWGAIWLLAIAAFLLAGCAGSLPGQDLLAEKLRPEKSTFLGGSRKGNGVIDTVSGNGGQKFAGAYQPGNDVGPGGNTTSFGPDDFLRIETGHPDTRQYLQRTRFAKSHPRQQLKFIGAGHTRAQDIQAWCSLK